MKIPTPPCPLLLDFTLAEGFLNFDGLSRKEFSHFIYVEKPFQAAIQRPFSVIIDLLSAYGIRKTFLLYFLHLSSNIFRCSASARSWINLPKVMSLIKEICKGTFFAVINNAVATPLHPGLPPQGEKEIKD